MKTCKSCQTSKHESEFYKSRSDCKACKRLKDKIARDANVEVYRERSRKQHQANLEERRSKQKAYRDNHYRDQRAKSKDHYSRNKDMYLTKAYLKDERLKQRIPSWQSDDDKKLIQCLYFIADRLRTLTGEMWHVDHVIPLNGRTVSGLHTPSNLRIIPAKQNLTKSNKYNEWTDS